MSADELKRTPLAYWHEDRGAKMVPFGGWHMPVQYTGIVEEHRAVRQAAGLFDVSHMGEFEFHGPGSIDLLERLLTSDIRSLDIGRVQYAMLLNDSGGTIDDTMVYRLATDHYLAVVNASNIEKDWAHVSGVAEEFGDVEAMDRSSAYALLALQGPSALSILDKVTDDDPASLPFHHVSRMAVNGVEAWVAASGYTGENGVEIFIPPEAAGEVMEALLEAGTTSGLLPAGLGARDTLRLEASLALYGHELDEETSPLEARLDFCVSDRDTFIGAEAIRRQREDGLSKRLVMLEMVEQAIPRQGYAVQNKDGKSVGAVTSGSFAPWLKKNIAMAFVPDRLTKIGREYWVDARGRSKKAVVVKRPFYKRPSR